MYRVNGNDLPKRSTVDCARSFIKTYVLKKTTWDISDKIQFPLFNEFYSGWMKKLKTEGKGDITHRPDIPAISLKKIHELGKILHELITGDPEHESYQELMDQVPANPDNAGNDKGFHYLCQNVVIFLFCHYLARRGREGLDMLKKCHFDLQNDGEGNYFFKKVIGEATKNHKSDSEDLENGGIIPFEPTPEGLSPGQFIQDWMSKLNPQCEFLFQRPRRLSSKFRLKDNPDVW